MSDEHILELIGLIYALVGAGMLFHQDHLHELVESFCDTPAATFIAGIAAVVIGFLLIVSRTTELDPVNGVMLVIGYAFLLKGAFILALPLKFEDVIDKMRTKKSRGLGITLSLAGIAIFYFGCFVL